jgi:hypothetical protein
MIYLTEVIGIVYRVANDVQIVRSVLVQFLPAGPVGLDGIDAFAVIIVLVTLASIVYTLVSSAERRWSDLTAPEQKGRS